ncbi:TolC family protein [Candidatus Magnetominusculus xianensis]|uniref:RND transporter n=1 Tax=Candidatus Magnetominusculus xianensis TaxID=1748249 RepID=A0ABR5SG91_9BACT|nr:TolC family protein [Candidatus Magnetominusculus xianensis]KWT85020.1 RND transporter [Candidatus Magnetominusculus xianensis]
MQSPLAYSSDGSEHVMNIRVDDVIRITIEKNTDIEAESYNPGISEADILVNKGEFDPSLNLGLDETYDRQKTSLEIDSTTQGQINYNLSLSGKAVTGTSYELKWQNYRYNGNSPFLNLYSYYSSGLSLTLTQPLLKGFGIDMQLTSLNAAKNTVQAKKYAFDSAVVAKVSEAVKDYWNLVTARKGIEAAAVALTLAQKTSDEVNARIAAGMTAPVDIYAAEAETAVREEALLAAENNARNAENTLKAIMNVRLFGTRLELLSSPPEPTTPPTLDSIIEQAHKLRQDYQKALIDKKNKELFARYYKNQMLPDLSAIASYGQTGLDGQYHSTIDELASGKYYSWKIGLVLNIPIFNWKNRGNYTKADLELKQTGAAIREIEKNITVEAAEAYNNLNYAIKKIKASGKSLLAAEKTLAAEDGKFRAGLSTLNDLLKFQRDYAAAIYDEAKSRADYAKSLVELNRIQGLLP